MAQPPKIAQVISAMIDAPDDIAEIVKVDREYYFSFRARLFSVVSKDLEYTLYVYPRYQGTVRGLADEFRRPPFGENIEFVSFTDSDVTANFKGLYTTVQERFLGLDGLFDSILK